MAVKILQHKKHRIGLAILAVVIALVLILALFINSYWSPILAQKIKKIVLTSSDGLYRADFSKANLHVLRGKLIIYNLSILPDSAVYNRRRLQHIAPNNLVQLHLKKLVINNLHPFELYFGHKLEIGEVILNDPDLVVSYQLNHKTDTVLQNMRTTWQQIKKTLRSVHIGSIYLNDVKFKYSDYTGHKVKISELKEMNVSATDLLIDSATQTDKTRLLYCRDIVAELNNYKGTTHSGLYNYTIKHLKLSTRTSQLNMEGLSLQPVNPDSFFDKTKKDRFTFNLDSLQINNFDYLSYHKYRTVNAARLLAKNGTFELFNNPNKLKKPGIDKITSFPPVALTKIGTDIRLDTILVQHINVHYSEYNKKSYQTGTVRFENTSGHFLNVTNNKAAITKNNICRVALTTYFMNRGKLDLLTTFNLSDKDVPYTYKGTLGFMDMEQINPAIMPLAMVKITLGTVKQFSFDIHANSHVAKGNVKLLYNDLKVKLLDPDTAFNGFKGKFIESIYANLFIIKRNNPDNATTPARSFNVNYIRPKNSPFFKTMWATLLTGIKPAIGLDVKTEHATAAQQMARYSNKQKHLIKKALRQQRRAARHKKKELDKLQKNK
jgi:hypothetical protein